MHYEDRNSKVNDTYHYGGNGDFFSRNGFWLQKMTFIHSHQQIPTGKRQIRKVFSMQAIRMEVIINIYKYSLDDVNIAIAKCNDTAKPAIRLFIQRGAVYI